MCSRRRTSFNGRIDDSRFKLLGDRGVAMITATCGRQLAGYRMARRERARDGRVRPPSEGVLGYESTCAAGWTRSKSSFREMLSVSAVMSTTLPSRICIKKAYVFS
jgi:hypothetical protein